MQTLDIYRHACHHQIHSISSLGKALINISKGVPVDSPERIGRDNTEANLVLDYYERFVWLRGLHHGEKRIDLFQACFIKQSVTQARRNTSANLYACRTAPARSSGSSIVCHSCGRDVRW